MWVGGDENATIPITFERLTRSVLRRVAGVKIFEWPRLPTRESISNSFRRIPPLCGRNKDDDDNRQQTPHFRRLITSTVIGVVVPISSRPVRLLRRRNNAGVMSLREVLPLSLESHTGYRVPCPALPLELE